MERETNEGVMAATGRRGNELRNDERNDKWNDERRSYGVDRRRGYGPRNSSSNRIDPKHAALSCCWSWRSATTQHTTSADILTLQGITNQQFVDLNETEELFPLIRSTSSTCWTTCNSVQTTRKVHNVKHHEHQPNWAPVKWTTCKNGQSGTENGRLLNLAIFSFSKLNILWITQKTNVTLLHLPWFHPVLQVPLYNRWSPFLANPPIA